MWPIEEYEIARTVTYRPWENAGRTFSLSTYPYLDIVMNDACNARCQFCIGHLVHDNARADIETFRAKIKFSVEQMGVKEVLLLGGEATILTPPGPTITAVVLNPCEPGMTLRTAIKSSHVYSAEAPEIDPMVLDALYQQCQSLAAMTRRLDLSVKPL